MRAAAILGPEICRNTWRSSDTGNAEWSEGPPASSSDADVVVIFGGDGTVHRHLPQLVTLGLPVLVVPCGSGNDFARALKLRSVRDSLAAWRQFAAGGSNVRTIDLGIIRELGEGKSFAGGAPAPHKPRRTFLLLLRGRSRHRHRNCAPLQCSSQMVSRAWRICAVRSARVYSLRALSDEGFIGRQRLRRQSPPSSPRLPTLPPTEEA